jgi:hypothetical protein
LKAEAPILVTESGIAIDLISLHPSNACASILVDDGGISIEEDDSNAFS